MNLDNITHSASMTLVPLYDNISSSLNSTWEYLVSTTMAPKKASFADLVRAETTYQVAKVINNNKFHVLMAMSLIGNGLSLFAVRRRMTTSTSCFYIANLAICDALIIFTKWLYIILGAYNPNQTSWECKVMNYLCNVALSSSVWLVVLMTVERCVAVIWPLKISGWVSMKRARIVVSILYAIMAAFNSVYLIVFTSKRTRIRNGNTCSIHESHMPFFKSIWSVIDMVFYAYIPQILIFILNIVIIMKLARATKEQAEMRNASKSEQSQGQVTAMLLTVSITFFVLTNPYTIFYLCMQNDVWNYMASARSYAQYALVSTLLRLLADLNHCINFLLYVATGKRFREDIVQLFRCAKANRPSTSSRGRGTSISSVAITVSEENRRGKANM